jgi:hypothetical protein
MTGCSVSRCAVKPTRITDEIARRGGLLPMGSSRALSRACISQRGRYMLPGGPANAAANAHCGPLGAQPRVIAGGCARSSRLPKSKRLHHGPVRRVPPGEATLPARAKPGAALPPTGWPVGFRPRRGGLERAGAPSLHRRHFPGTAEGCPSRRHSFGRPAMTGEGPVGSPVLKLWNESRTNRARIADSIHVGFRSRPHIVAGRSPTTKSCNRTDTIAATRASTR